MTINWGALVLVAVVTITAAISIVGLFALGVAALTVRQRTTAHGTAPVMATVAGYSCLAVSWAIATYGLGHSPIPLRPAYLRRNAHPDGARLPARRLPTFPVHRR